MTAACPTCRSPLPDGSRYCPACGTDTSLPGGGPRTAVGAELLRQLRAALGDRYEVREQLGRGGMGAVFLAVDRRLDRDVAIKVLPPELAHDQQFAGRFEHEARTAARLDHPGIIPIYAVESAVGLHYFVMKYVNGRSLEGLLAAGPAPVDLTQRILWEAACALGHAHQRGVVHRDIKPANMMLDESGRLLLTDFGISKALRSASAFTATGQVIGTPHYMSPEQARGEDVAGASDQYSLAVVGYRMLAGRLPFEEDSVHTVIYKHVFEQPPDLRSLRPGIPPFLAAAIHRAMHKDPGRRYATMEAFATAAWPENPVEPRPGSGAQVRPRRSVTSTDAPTEISQPTAGHAVAPRRRRSRWPVAVASAIAVIGSGTAALTLTPAGRDLLQSAGMVASDHPAPPDTATAGTATPADTTPADSGASGVVPPARDTSPATPPARLPAVPPAERQAARAPASAPARQGQLNINATPAGIVVIDGKEYDYTPQVIPLPVGFYVLEVRREGFRTFRERIEITAGNETRKHVTLVPDTP